MIITHEREKLINAIVYFAKNIQFLGKVKLFKLLYFLDFDHYKEVGRSVTGLDYFAWKMGPVPVSLYKEVDMPEQDMAEKIEFIVKKVRNGDMLTVLPLCDFDQKHFTKRELRIMQSLVDQYANARAEEMVEATHLENQPWHKVYIEEGNKQKIIPYKLSVRKQELNEINDLANEREEFIRHLS
ncbi:MAG: SocA family protein [Burkholderiales bacterium]|nr:SocA family protein [Burkholderiales bacterium]